MPTITESRRARRASLVTLGAYLALALVAAGWRLARGDGSAAAVAAYLVLLSGLTLLSRRSGRLAEGITGWLPLLALPVLYWSVPATAIGGGGGFQDVAVQAWDRALFGADPARAFAGAWPWMPVSEVLHAAYLSYYVIIYGPPLLMYARGAVGAFDESVLAFTIAMVFCFAVFCLMPVAGPRYEWPAPAGMPDGPFRRLSVFILERGSAHGTAFPSSHLAIATSLGLSAAAYRRWLGGVTLALAVLLGLGAVYGGFHYAVDMLAGAAVGAGAWGVATVVSRRGEAGLA